MTSVSEQVDLGDQSCDIPGFGLCLAGGLPGLGTRSHRWDALWRAIADATYHERRVAKLIIKSTFI